SENTQGREFVFTAKTPATLQNFLAKLETEIQKNYPKLLDAYRNLKFQRAIRTFVSSGRNGKISVDAIYNQSRVWGWFGRIRILSLREDWLEKSMSLDPA